MCASPDRPKQILVDIGNRIGKPLADTIKRSSVLLKFTLRLARGSNELVYKPLNALAKQGWGVSCRSSEKGFHVGS